MIKLDYDNIAFEELEKRVEFILKDPLVLDIEIYQSTSLDGYHLYVKTCKGLSFLQKIPYRQKWKDDGKRIEFDLLKDDEKLKDVLFSKRLIKGKIVDRIFIGKYQRL